MAKAPIRPLKAASSARSSRRAAASPGAGVHATAACVAGGEVDATTDVVAGALSAPQAVPPASGKIANMVAFNAAGRRRDRRCRFSSRRTGEAKQTTYFPVQNIVPISGHRSARRLAVMWRETGEIALLPGR